jgi:hypothetical protein
MKLFTADIDKKLFAQYLKGSDLANQVVVAKIFNPYGRGTWYLLNSDPEDPEYLWAIVDMDDIEVGSVNRSDLENIRIKPFMLGLERDLSFTPMNAAEIYRGLNSGKTYAKGGGVTMKHPKSYYQDLPSNLNIKYKGYIPYVANSYSQKFNQISTLLRDYSEDTIVNENGRTDFKEPKYYSYGYLKSGTTLGTKRGWVLNLPKKGVSIEMQYHPQKFETINDLYWVFEGRVFTFPEDATIETKKLTEKNQAFRDEYGLGNSLLGYGKKNYVSFDDGDTAAIDMNYDASIKKSNKYYAIYFGDEKDGLFEKGLVTHCLPNAYLYARQYDVQQAHLLTIENGKVIDTDDVYPYSDSTDLQEIATDWLNDYLGGISESAKQGKKFRTGGYLHGGYIITDESGDFYLGTYGDMGEKLTWVEEVERANHYDTYEEAKKVADKKQQGAKVIEYKKGGATLSQNKKVGKVMHEFKQGDLHSGKSGKIVKNPKQAIAIALSEGKRGWKHKK